MNVTLQQLVDFVLKNRRGKAFLNYSELNIASSILTASLENTLLYSVDSDGNIDGIVVATKSPEIKVMFINNILTTRHSVLQLFVRTFRKLYPQYSLRAERWHGPDRSICKIVTYNTDKLCSKLLKGI